MFSILRALFALVSLIILAAAIYLLWTWHHGIWVRDADGVLHHVRHAWQLWAGGALLVWSLLGRSVLLPLLAHRDTDPMRLERGDGRLIDSPTGAKLYVETYGPEDGQPLILTHGWSLDSRIWYYAKRALDGRFRLIVWDLPGLGKSRRARGKVDMAGFTGDLATVLGLAGGRPAVLVGHSIGGMVVQTLARERPELFGREVSGVVLLATTYTNPLKTMILSGLAQALRWPVIEPMMRLTILLQPLVWLSMWQSYLSGSSHIANRFGFGRFVTRSQLEATTRLLTMQSPAVSAHGDLAMFRWDSHESLRDCPVPVLAIGGSGDIVTRPEASKVIAGFAADGRLEIIEGVNHMGPIERADVYHAALTSFALAMDARPAT